jgi:hypothetical protein
MLRSQGLGQALRQGGGLQVHGHAFLLPSQQRSTSSNRGGIYAYPYDGVSDTLLIPEVYTMTCPNPYR